MSATRWAGQNAFLRPTVPFLTSLRNPRVLAFVGVWFAVTIIFGSGIVPLGLDEGSSIAWEAHLGGFIGGLVLFPLLDPIKGRA